VQKTTNTELQMKTLLNTFVWAALMLEAVLHVRFRHFFASGGAGVDASNPQPDLRARPNHRLAIGLLSVSLIVPQVFGGAVLTPLMSFNGTNGSVPEATLLLGTDGMLYGTTIGGGTNNVASGGGGTVFRISTNGTFETLANLDLTSGGEPQAGLMQGSDGCFYGTTLLYSGIVFKITPEGVFSTFASLNWPAAVYANGLVEGADRFLYGTAYYGGTNGDYGSVFKISTNGKVTLLAGFNDSNGARPQAALMRGADGNFYGTTVNGGTNGGWGTVFRITPAGELTSLVSFSGTNGAHPMSALRQAANGIIYGTTSGGGIGFQNTLYTGHGTIFKMTPRGRLITLHFFTGYPDDGSLLRLAV
jgi:uncharacterized repeat protein (TIGR03803 family)